MAYSSILGADVAPTQPSGRESELLGPSDNSDSGSDTLGTHEAYADSDSHGTGERGGVGADGREGGDILPDHVVRLSAEETEEAIDPSELTDLDEGAPEDEEA